MKLLTFFWIIFSSTFLYSLQPPEAFDKLMEGNKRFQKNRTLSPNQDAQRRESVAGAQAPFAVIVACADSRVAPEILFDQGIGDLFVVRVAGNVIGPFEMESINYAAKYLGSSCILVMGHENCGAINAVIQGQTADIPSIAQVINPIVIKAKRTRGKNLLQKTTKMNAEAMSALVMQSPIVAQLASQGKIDVRSGYYNFQTGAVELLNNGK